MRHGDLVTLILPDQCALRPDEVIELRGSVGVLLRCPVGCVCDHSTVVTESELNRNLYGMYR